MTTPVGITYHSEVIARKDCVLERLCPPCFRLTIINRRNRLSPAKHAVDGAGDLSEIQPLIVPVDRNFEAIYCPNWRCQVFLVPISGQQFLPPGPS